MSRNIGLVAGSALIAIGCGVTIRGVGRATIYSMIWSGYWWVLIASTVAT